MCCLPTGLHGILNSSSALQIGSSGQFLIHVPVNAERAWQLLFWSPVTSLVCSSHKMLQKLWSDGRRRLQALIPEVFRLFLKCWFLTIKPRNFFFFPPNESYMLITWIRELVLKFWKTCPELWCCSSIGAFCTRCVLVKLHATCSSWLVIPIDSTH